jgi:hypothetical protein
MNKTILCAIILCVIAGFVCMSYVYCEKPAQEEYKYESKGKRDPFVPLLGQEKAKISSLEGITSIQDVNLDGIAIGSGGKSIAILNGQMVKEGSKFGTLQIKKISQKTVRLTIDGNEYTLKLQGPEKGNKGGK